MSAMMDTAAGSDAASRHRKLSVHGNLVLDIGFDSTSIGVFQDLSNLGSDSFGMMQP